MFNGLRSVGRSLLAGFFGAPRGPLRDPVAYWRNRALAAEAAGPTCAELDMMAAQVRALVAENIALVAENIALVAENIALVAAVDSLRAALDVARRGD